MPLHLIKSVRMNPYAAPVRFGFGRDCSSSVNGWSAGRVGGNARDDTSQNPMFVTPKPRGVWPSWGNANTPTFRTPQTLGQTLGGMATWGYCLA